MNLPTGKGSGVIQASGDSADLVPMVRAIEEGLLPADIAPVHWHYILAGAVGLIFHQAEECKRLAGTDPATPEAAEAHARAVEHLFLGPANEETPR